MTGTVGDIESLPFLEAIRQFGLEKGRRNVMYIHLTLLPYLNASGAVISVPSSATGSVRHLTSNMFKTGARSSCFEGLLLRHLG